MDFKTVQTTIAQHLFQLIRVHTVVDYSIEEKGEGEGEKRKGRGLGDDVSGELSRCVTHAGKFYFTIERDF